MHFDAMLAGGGDPWWDLPALLSEAGFTRVWTAPSFLPALSSVEVIGTLFLRRLQAPDFVARVAARGRYSPARMCEMTPAVTDWMQRAWSIAAISACVGLAWKSEGRRRN